MTLQTRAGPPELDAALMPCKEKADAEGWLMTPVLILDEQVVFRGYVPEKERIKEKIINYMKEVKKR